MNRTVLGPSPCKTTAASIAVALLALTLIGCGGGSAPPPPPTPDFTLSVSPSSVETGVGTKTAPVVISVTGQTGFTGSVSVSLQGLPPGITVSPSSSFSLAAGASQPLTFFVPDTTSVGGTAITVLASGGSHSHSAQLTLTADAIVRTYQVGSVLYLESGNATDVARIGLETAWGGSIVEVSLNGTEFVNRDGTGREVQVSYRDGNNIRWNPTLAGDDFNQGTPTIAYNLTSSSLYTKAQPLQWYAESFGGTLGQPVFGDVMVEQTVTAVTNQPHTFKVHYEATHLANDLHPDAAQEFPAVYTNGNYNRFVYYGGVSPWANGAVSVTQFPNLPAFSPELYVPEHWGALVDTQNLGLTVFVPSQYPYVLGFASLSPGGSGPTDDWTNYFAPFVTFDIGPNFVFQGDIYLIAGDYRARNWPYAYSESIRPDSRIKNHIGVTVLPKGDGPRDQHANMLGGFQLMISRTSRNKSAAIELIRFLSSPEIQRVNAISRGYAPTRSALYKDPKILQVNPLFGPLRNVLEAGAAIRPSTAAGPQYEKVSTLYFTAMREALLGRKTANDAVRELEEQLKSLDAR